MSPRIIEGFESCYLSQRDNVENPSGSCNVTSLAMTLTFFGIKKGASQLEDELYNFMLDKGKSRHSPYDLAWTAENFDPSFKVTDTFTEFGTFNTIKESLSKNCPCIIHGYFTRGGHIVVVYGYDDYGFLIADPWGEWHSWGYDNDASGLYTLSYGTFAKLTSPESPHSPSNIFTHSIHATKLKNTKK